MGRHQLLRITSSARYLVLLAVGVPVLWSRDLTGGRALLAIAAVWVVAEYATARFPRGAWGLPVGEAVVVGAICGLVVDGSPALFTTLAVAPFVAGLMRGLPGVGVALVVQSVALATVWMATGQVLTAPVSQDAFTWMVGAAGLGMIGSFVHATAMRPPEGLAAYRAARDLLHQLSRLAGQLGGSLDVPTTADEVLHRVARAIPVEGLTLYLPRDGAMVPIHGLGSPPSGLDDVAALARTTGAPVCDGELFALPLQSTGVVAGRGHPAVADRVPALLRELQPELTEPTVRLDAALLFADFRDTATADERRRLAREMHDGVAQDLAGLGYLVDALASHSDSPDHAEQIAVLRRRLTDVVSEVRRSVHALRSPVAESDGLEAAVAAVAGRLSEASGIPVQVTHGDPGPRLRPEVEAELFRIAQEAITNAVKHSRAARIEVDLVVRPPGATLTVTDDGRGMGASRDDSHGLTIMRERARMIGAEVTHRQPLGGGTQVLVHLPSTPERQTPMERVEAR